MCNCNLTTCRYNADGKCENEEKRKECVEVSRKVLCLEGKARKAKKLLPMKISDCKKAYEKDGKYRYVIINSLAIQVPIFLCKTYKEAEKQINWFREMGLYPLAKIVDLEEYGEWKSAYDKEPICKE